MDNKQNVFKKPPNSDDIDNNIDIMDQQDIEYNREFTNDFCINPFEQNALKRKREIETKTKTKIKKETEKASVIMDEYCHYFGSAKGCINGRFCAFSHSNPNSVAFCEWYNSKWGCKWNHQCIYRHTQFNVKDNNNNTNYNNNKKFHQLPEIKMLSISNNINKPKPKPNEFIFNTNAIEFIPNSSQKNESENIKSSLNKNAVEFVPTTVTTSKTIDIKEEETKYDVNDIGMNIFAENEIESDDMNKLNILPEIKMIGNAEMETVINNNSNKIMPPIHENIELDDINNITEQPLFTLNMSNNSNDSNNNKIKSKLNENAKEFVPVQINDSQNYHKAFVKDLRSNPFHKNPFKNKKTDEETPITLLSDRSTSTASYDEISDEINDKNNMTESNISLSLTLNHEEYEQNQENNSTNDNIHKLQKFKKELMDIHSLELKQSNAQKLNESHNINLQRINNIRMITID